MQMISEALNLPPIQVYYEAATNPTNLGKLLEKAKRMLKRDHAKHRIKQEPSSKKQSESDEASS